MIRWEYTTLKISLDGIVLAKLDEEKTTTELNAMGKDGWELVSVVHPAESRRYLFFFKRPGPVT